MYKVIKEKGYGANISIENTDTKATLIIGHNSIDITGLLEEAGYKFTSKEEEDKIKYTDAWSLKVNKDIANKLAHLAMKMKKPIRDQRKIKPEKDNKKIDAMDVLLGLAHYN